MSEKRDGGTATRSEAEKEIEACHGLLTQLKMAAAGPDGQPLTLLDRLRAIFDPLNNPEVFPLGRPEDRLTEPETLAQRVQLLEQQLRGLVEQLNAGAMVDAERRQGLVAHLQQESLRLQRAETLIHNLCRAQLTGQVPVVPPGGGPVIWTR